MTAARTTTAAPPPLPASADREPGWLAETRERAWRVFLDTPRPDRVAHLWRYSDPDLFEADGPPGRGAPEREAIPSEDLPRGLARHPLSRACRLYASLARGHLGSLVPAAHGRFEAWNLARWNAGEFLYVSEGQRPGDPVDLRLDLDRLPDVTSARSLIVVERDAEVSVVTGLSGGRPGQLVNQVVEVHLAAGSRVRLSGILAHAGGVRVHRTQRALLGRGANLLQMLASLGGAATKVDTGSVLAGPGAEARLFGFAFGTKEQLYDHHTVHEHRAARTSSNLDFKVVLRDRARSAYTGNIRIERGAGGSEAYQENRNLLLGRGPRAESIPELEILTDDVRCSHGSATGPIDEEQVHYLRSRGISRTDAERLLVAGFLAPTLLRLPGSLAEVLRDEAERRLAAP